MASDAELARLKGWRPGDVLRCEHPLDTLAWGHRFFVLTAIGERAILVYEVRERLSGGYQRPSRWRGERKVERFNHKYAITRAGHIDGVS